MDTQALAVPHSYLLSFANLLSHGSTFLVVNVKFDVELEKGCCKVVLQCESLEEPADFHMHLTLARWIENAQPRLRSAPHILEQELDRFNIMISPLFLHMEKLEVLATPVPLEDRVLLNPDRALLKKLMRFIRIFENIYGVEDNWKASSQVHFSLDQATWWDGTQAPALLVPPLSANDCRFRALG